MSRADVAVVAVLIAIMVCSSIFAAAAMICDSLEKTRAEIKRVDVQYIENFTIEQREGARLL